MNGIRHSPIVLAFVAINLAGCAVGLRSPSKASVVGTWQWVAVDQHPVKEPFFIRYYPDGKATTWPAPAGWSTTNGVSYGTYHLSGRSLVLETGAGTNDPKIQIQVKGDKMTLINDESNHLTYRRVVPDLQPGQFLPGQVGHGAPDL